MSPANLHDLRQVRLDCLALVRRRAGVAAGASLIPIPLIDLGIDISLLMEMIPEINRRFGLSPEQIEALDPQLKHVAIVAIASLGNQLIGKLITRPLVLHVLKTAGVRLVGASALRFVPLAGQILAAGISFVAVRMLGNAHIEDCFHVVEKVMLEQLPVVAQAPESDATTAQTESSKP